MGLLMKNSIPKRIIQTGKSRQLSQIEKATTHNIRSLNPDFEYVYFDNDEVNDFVEQTFPEYKKIFHGFKYNIQKYDFFRYLAVYHHGGFYFDLDVLLSESVSDLTMFDCVFPFEQVSFSTYFMRHYKLPWDIGNYAFGATAKNSFIKKVIESVCLAQENPEWASPIIKSIPPFYYPDSIVLCTTGPLLVTRVYAEHPELHESIKVLMPDDICDRKNWNKFGRYGIHLISASWRKPKTYIRKKIRTQLTDFWVSRQIKKAGQIVSK